ncbi:MAG TPA: CSLREA domain-containing protein, partial [Kofleriaceae bacterium]|nr:CSLREA domain-containing protein [Kofleriaceae bacterium]
MRSVVLLAGLAACDFVHGALNSSVDAGGDSDSEIDASIDAPPMTTAVKFTTVTSTLGSVRPGAYGWQVTAVLRNELPDDITNIRPTLTFTIGTEDRASSFRWRDIDMREAVATLPATTLASNSEVTYKFVVDALPWLMGPGTLQINGAATFDSTGASLSATPAMTPVSLPFVAMNAPIVVTTLTDEMTNNTTTSLREAITQARAVPGLDHITFDPAVFTAGSTSTLSSTLGELPTLDGANDQIVIDGHGANVTLVVGTAWQSSSRWPFRVTGGQAVIAGIRFKDFGYNYPAEDVSSDNCGSGNHNEGGAIRVDGGTLTLEGNTFDDGNVAERNCYASLLRYEGGTNHRVINNRWTNQSQDAMY